MTQCEAEEDSGNVFGDLGGVRYCWVGWCEDYVVILISCSFIVDFFWY